MDVLTSNAPLSPGTVEAAVHYVEHKSRAIRRRNGAWLSRVEVRLRNRLVRRFKTQMNWVVDEMSKLSFFEQTPKSIVRIERKAAEDEVEKLVGDLPENEYIAEDIVVTSRTSYRKGARTAGADIDIGKYGISFDIVNGDAIQYLQRLRDLHLSNFRGSISRTTRDRIRKILIDAAQSGQSYADTARQIREQANAGVFSQARGELIATNEVGNAYSQGNMDMVDRFTEKVGEVDAWKRWEIVSNELDDECDDNNGEGWVPTHHVFSSGDTAPLAHPRCLCFLSFQVTPKGEEPTD